MPNHITNILKINRIIFESDRQAENELAIDFDVIREFCRGETEMDFEKIVPGRPRPVEKETSSPPDWYNWSVKNWGTKWNAICSNCGAKCIPGPEIFAWVRPLV